MLESTDLELPEIDISNSTYPEFIRLAEDLHSRIKERVDFSVEPIDFGSTALDVGSRDCRYVSVIRKLGPKSITVIDPSIKELQKGIDAGFVNKEEVFSGTLEEYVKQTTSQVDSVFIFNVNPNLSNSPEFGNAISRIVKPGGIVVVAFAEKGTASKLVSIIFGEGKLKSIWKKPRKENESIRIKDDHEDGVNRFLSIGRKTE